MNTPELTLLRADWIAPFDRPGAGASRGLAIVVDGGRIAAVGDAGDLSISYPNAKVRNLGAAIILPGLVNAHVHLELSDLQCGSPPAEGFAPWLLKLVKRSSGEPEKLAVLVQKAIEEGVKECLRFGVTSVGDISRQCGVSRPLLRNGPLRVTSYGEVQAMARRRELLATRLATASDWSNENNWLKIGISPHAPYTVEPAGYAECLRLARQRNMPLATHLAESEDEAEFLHDQTGPFRELWEALGQWDESVPRFEGGPIRLAHSLGLLDYPTLLAHVNYCNDAELNILAAGKASVVYCPRTHRYFGHKPHRWREMLARGINVAIGTDSRASSPDLNVVDDLRLVHEIAPEIPVEQLWEMVTMRGARAIEAEAKVGRLAAGLMADFSVFAVETDEPLRGILERNLTPTQTWIEGKMVWKK